MLWVLIRIVSVQTRLFVSDLVRRQVFHTITLICHVMRKRMLNLEAPNTTIAEFANTVDPDETEH